MGDTELLLLFICEFCHSFAVFEDENNDVRMLSKIIERLEVNNQCLQMDHNVLECVFDEQVWSHLQLAGAKKL